MSEPILARVKLGVNIKTFSPIYYLEARVTPRKPWRMVVSNGKWWTTRSKAVADKEAKKLDRRLRARASGEG